MLFEQFYLQSLGHASYLVADERTGKALVVDPRRDVDIYFDTARSHDVQITMAIDTHGHNDYLSGLSELAARSEITVLGSAVADLGYDHRPVKDGEVIEFGEVALEVLHTPGHTPEHVALLVSEPDTSPHPAILLSGGSLLVGDLARPDLLGGEDETRQAARAFCATLQDKILSLPDSVEVFPTHVAGSLCGGSIGSRLSTTVGYERRSNPVLARLSASAEPVDDCLSTESLPAVPPYWRRMRAQNLAGVALLGAPREPPALQPDEFEQARERGAIVLDTRAAEAFAGGHVPRSLNAGLGPSFPTWAGTIVEDGADVLLVVERAEDVATVTVELSRIGYGTPAGWLAGGMKSWRSSGLSVGRIPTVDVQELRELMKGDRVRVLDVRQPGEWSDGVIPGAQLITGAELPERLGEVSRDTVVATVCGSGYRSSVASSLLAADGRAVVNVLGGMAAWNSAGFPTES